MAAPLMSLRRLNLVHRSLSASTFVRTPDRRVLLTGLADALPATTPMSSIMDRMNYKGVVLGAMSLEPSAAGAICFKNGGRNGLGSLVVAASPAPCLNYASGLALCSSKP
jgi:hypothetical protein